MHGKDLSMKLLRIVLIMTVLFLGGRGYATVGSGDPGTAGYTGNGRHILDAGDSAGYRTFRPDSLALSRDDHGRAGKYVKPKPARILFSVLFRNTVLGANVLHVEFSAPLDTSFPVVLNRTGYWNQIDLRMAKWDISFPAPLDGGDTVLITAHFKSSIPVRIARFSWRLNGVTYQTSGSNYSILLDEQKYPMPNRINALYDAFMVGGFVSTNGLVVGISRTLDSIHYYGWLQAVNYLDVLKSLIYRSDLETGAPRGFDYYTTIPIRPILNEQKYITPVRQNNRLLGDMIALKLNIVASALGITPVGFGELIYNDSSANPLNGLMVKEIAERGDTMMNGWYNPGSRIHVFPPSADFANLAATVESLNVAFEGPLDTIGFFDTLRFTPVRILADVPYLYSNPNAVPVRIHPTASQSQEYQPQQFSLLQNYPNPFNPTTTIEFNLPATSIVSLTVYNILGQKVMTLYDHAMLEDGLYETEVNGANLASGIYFYHLVADGVGAAAAGENNHLSAVKKMILMKLG